MAVKVQTLPNGTLQGIHLRVMGHAMSTGILFGGIITANGDNTFNISAGRGYIVDVHTDWSMPSFTELVWDEITNEPLLTTGIISNISLSSTGVVQQSEDIPTPEFRRSNLHLGRIGVTSQTAVQEHSPVWSPSSI